MGDNPLNTLVFVPTVDQSGEIGMGGAERMARNLCHAFDRNVVSPMLLTLRDAGTAGEELRERGVKTFVLKKRGKIDPIFWHRFRKLLEDEKVDAVLSMIQGANFHNLIVTPTARRVACIIRLARMDLPRSIGEIEGRLAARADMLVVNAEPTKMRAARHYRVPQSRIRFIPNGCDEIRFKFVPYGDRFEYRKRLGLPENVFLIYSAGRIHPDKGFDLLAEALALLPENARNRIHWVHSGSIQSAEMKSRINAAVRSKGLSVEMLSAVRNTEDYIAASDVVAVPSRRDAFPNVLLESGSVGRRIIATSTGEVPRAAANIGGVTVSEQGAPAIMQALAAAMEYPEAETAAVCISMSEKTRLHYGLTTVAAEYAEMIHEAFAIRRGRQKR